MHRELTSQTKTRNGIRYIALTGSYFMKRLALYMMTNNNCWTLENIPESPLYVDITQPQTLALVLKHRVGYEFPGFLGSLKLLIVREYIFWLASGGFWVLLTPSGSEFK
jgi:hypothetical protein